MVSQVTKGSLEDDPNAFSYQYEKALRTLETRQVSSDTMETIDARVQRLAKKARIGIQDNLAEALVRTWAFLKTIASDDFQDDDEIKLSNLPEQMQFLLELAAPPLPSTLAHADIVLSGEREFSAKSNKLTWKQIMEEEPFEGDHWEGVFSPGRAYEGDTSPSFASDQESEAEGFLSHSGESQESETSYTSTPAPIGQILTEAVYTQSEYFQGSSSESRELVERLRGKQTWRREWEMDVNWNRPFNTADPSTFAATVSRVMEARVGGRIQVPKVINEVDTVRNILLLLQGIDSPSTIFLVDDFEERTQASIAADAPRLMHISLDAYRSILTEFCFSATRLQEMRHFIRSVYAHRDERRTKGAPTMSPVFVSRTLEAFAEAVDAYIRDVDKWCAGREEAIVQARSGTGRQTVATLLSCYHEMKEKVTLALDILQDILRQLVKQELRKDGTTHHRGDVERLGFLRAKNLSSIHPSILSTRLLDLLVHSINTQLAIGEHPTACLLIDIFVKTAEPVWKLAGKWMRDGMRVGGSLEIDDLEQNEQDPELFIQFRDINFTDPDFWEQGYTLRREGEDDWEDNRTASYSRPQLVPNIFATIASDILAAGKVVGLLRAMGIDPLSEEQFQFSATTWGTFSDIYTKSQVEGAEGLEHLDVESPEILQEDATYGSRIVMGLLNATMTEHILPWCKSPNLKLKKLLLDDCDMMEHFAAFENFYFMRQGDAMTAFCDQIFFKLDAHEKWHDLHFLNKVLREVSMRDRKPWISPELVQFQVRGGREKNNISSVRCFDGLVADYTVPFPLTYILQRPSSAIYASVFVLLIQVRRAKSVMDHLSMKDASQVASGLDVGDLNQFFALKAKFSWFINTLMNFLTIHVISANTTQFQVLFKKASTLDEMITSHDHHLAQLQILCFLQSKTAAVHRTLLSILDLALQFVSCFSAYLEERTSNGPEKPLAADISHKKRRHHQKRARRNQRNTIGFADDVVPSDVDSSSSDDEEIKEEDLEQDQTLPEITQNRSRPSLTSSISFAEESFTVKIDRVSDELDGLVRYVRKAVDVLAGGSNETSAVFGVFSFMLEEWDM